MLSDFGKSFGGRRLTALAACLGSLLAAGCSPIPSHPKAPASPGFSESVVRAHLENLARIGVRLPGSDPDSQARVYLEREFELAGVPLEALEEGGFRHLVGEISGVSAGSILLVAPYPALGTGARVDDSGAVLLLELGRLLAQTPLPYAVRIALADVRPSVEAPSKGWAAANPSLLARQQVVRAGESLVRALEASGRLTGVRAVVAFEPRADVEPRMARDLRSHPVIRALFWEVAAELGYGDSFPPDAGWRSPAGLQAAFRERGLGQVLALVDETTARVELQVGLGGPSGLERDESADLSPIGSVTLEALSRLMRRFERIDAFAK